MTTIYTTASSQVPTPHAGGRDRMPGEGDGRGTGRFEDTFEGIATKGNASANRAGSSRDGGEDGRQSDLAEGQGPEVGVEGRSPASGRSDDAKAIRYQQADHGTKPGTDALLGSRFDLSAKALSKLPGGRGSGEPAGDDRADDVTTDAVPASDYDGLLSLLAANEATRPDLAGAATSVSGTTGPAGRSGRVREAGADDAARGAAGALGRGAGQAAFSDMAEHAAMDESVEGGGADRIFRLARADGRGKSVEIAISGNGEASAPKEPSGAAAKFDAVTVLDSRRYLGLAQTSNSTAVTAAIAQDPSWAAALTEAADSSRGATGKVVNTLKIQLHPIDLGNVTATLRLQGEALVVELKVETGKAYRNLSDEQEAIVKALRGHGFNVDQVSIQMTSPSDRSGGAGQGDAQFSGQQQAREGGRQGEPRTSGIPATNEGIAHDDGHAGSLDGAGQPRGTGGVYL